MKKLPSKKLTLLIISRFTACFFLLIATNNSYAEENSLGALPPSNNAIISTNRGYDQLSEEEKTSIKELRNLLNKQPKSIQEEVLLYRDYIEKLKRQKKDYYDELSKEAKDFLNQEKALKDKLSDDTRKEFYKKHLFN